MSNDNSRVIDPADFVRFDAVPDEGVERAVGIMRTGRLCRYSEVAPEKSEVALLERDFADYLGVKHVLAVSSCTQAIELALLACGVKPGSKVLVPGFTFTAVPSAVVMLNACPVFVECNMDLRIDVDDLRRKISEETNVLLLSHMRGHTSDLDAIRELCAEHGVIIIEDAAHALGGRWNGKPLGTFGRAGCFSFQSNKIINGGEGGLLVTNEDELIVKATYLSGAYEENYRKHFIQSTLFEDFSGGLPIHNARMTNVTAAVIRPQLPLVEPKARRYREMYGYLKQELALTERIEFPGEYAQETRVPDSVQFRVRDCDRGQMQRFCARVRECGLPLAGFAERNNARAFFNWHYLNGGRPDLPMTERAIRNTCDMRLASSLTKAHLDYIVATVQSALHDVGTAPQLAVAQ